MSAGKPNLSIKRIEPTISGATLHPSIDYLISDCVAKSEFARDWGNRHLAHRDLACAISDADDPLELASRGKTVAVLKCMVGILNDLSLHYHDSTTFFDAGDTVSDTKCLFYLPEDRLRAQKD